MENKKKMNVLTEVIAGFMRVVNALTMLTDDMAGTLEEMMEEDEENDVPDFIKEIFNNKNGHIKDIKVVPVSVVKDMFEAKKNEDPFADAKNRKKNDKEGK